MATMQQLESALVGAHNAGDTRAATILANEIIRMRKESAAAEQVPELEAPLNVPEDLQHPAPAQPAPKPTLGEQVIGAGETALTAITGATGGTLGMLGGFLGSIAGAIRTGELGSQEAADMIERAAMESAGRLTYQPRTQAGQQQIQALSEITEPLVALTSMATQIGAATQAARGVTRQALVETGQQVREAARRGVTIERPPRVERVPETADDGLSVGAAQVETARLRQAEAEQLPHPVPLTKGQATRDFEQLRFERETAKDPERGATLRERYNEQNALILRNFDAWVDATGAEAPDLRATGIVVDKVLKDRARADKNRIRVAYTQARNAGEMAEPVAADPVVSLLNESFSAESTAPILRAARNEIIRLGGAATDADGNLAPRQLSINDMEQLRKFINANTGHDAPNQLYAGRLKEAIDLATENAGGDLYRRARDLRKKFAEKYEDHAVIADLLNEKRGTSDRRVALEDVFDRIVLRGSLDDMRHARRVIQTAGEEGRQAWREIQGAAMSYIKNEATKNVQRDELGNPIVSPAALDKAIKRLSADRKLDYLFGERGSEQLEAINDLVKYIYTSPPGTINTSNTASVLLAAMDMAISGQAGMPAPVLSGLKIISKKVKDAKIRRRVNEALRFRANGE